MSKSGTSDCAAAQPSLADIIRERSVRLREAGFSDTELIAELVIDRVVIDRMKEAGAADLHPAGDGPGWVAAELTHAVQFGLRWGRMSEDDLRSAFEEALARAVAKQSGGSGEAADDRA